MSPAMLAIFPNRLAVENRVLTRSCSDTLVTLRSPSSAFTTRRNVPLPLRPVPISMTALCSGLPA